jgi:hypothetical protein
MVFADYTRTVYMTDKTSNILQNILAAGGQGSVKSGLKTCTRIGKNCAVPSSHRDSFPAKEPGLYNGASSGKAYLFYCRAVRLSKNLLYLLITMKLVIPGKTMCFVP